MWCTWLAGNAGPKNLPKKSPSGFHHPTTLSGCFFATKAHIDNRKKLVKQQHLLHISLQYGELRHTSGWDRFVSLGHPCKFQRVSRLGRVSARHSSIGRQPNFAALNRGRHLYSAGGHHVGHWPTFLVAWCIDAIETLTGLLVVTANNLMSVSDECGTTNEFM